MNNVQGAFFSYDEFRQSLHQPLQSVRVWTSDELLAMRESLASSEVDIVALAHDNSIEGCKLTPGVAVSVQWLKPGAALNRHAHGWWHLFVIQAGSGLLTMGEGEEVRASIGDVLLVPAWTRHGFVNTSATEPMAMLNMSNMPQLALLSSMENAVS
ncbi:cupin domain-containing protein [Pseudomonas violetae]